MTSRTHRNAWRASGAAFAALALAAPAGAQPMYPAPYAAPVTINSCGPIINQNPSGPVTPGGFPLVGSSSGIAITFVNDASKTADLVNFAVDSNGERFIIRDVGTFSPGVSIVHQYRNGSGQAFILPAFIAPSISCHVDSVRFTDGTVWRRGQPPAVSVPAGGGGPVSLSANPARLTIDAATDSELFFVNSSDRVAAFRETDDCAGIATVFVAATGQASATYSVRPLAPGACSARVTDESGAGVTVPIVVR
jgi:hypothetical protein